ncbi:heterokaryon incompatibility protein-domain-containing protein [Durotheca rogersii]|uniref:heterokaryon incompatibility protein-domain-containing protein n=1 Tax=Durotheca rogersii TaxID=419775 RepID=UPI002220A1AD|nr:heterokaryon incompatibility protein-domain-containing protein [Durotheca rogersii]KAI5861658.1 heterokaryon incompatibility protein-domain-containing protein [Durotheca rogersii]
MATHGLPDHSLDKPKATFPLILMAKAVNDIVDDLCKRDSRFRIIQDLLREEQTGQPCLSLYEFAGVVLPKGRSVMQTSDLLSGIENEVMDVVLFLRDNESRPVTLKGISNGDGWLASSLYEIMLAVIYEIMDAFDISITAEHVPLKGDLLTHLSLLISLHRQSKQLGLKSPEPPPKTPQLDQGEGESRYRYQNSLASTSERSSTKLIRVLHLLPGSGDSPIYCRLEQRNLDTDEIEEALSYVWGNEEDPKSIYVDNRPFPVTVNLHDILLGLRYQHATRTIWIDAICINQSDPQEKAHQIRLMHNIYSKARKTTIWLTRQTPELAATGDPSDILGSLPPGFGGNTIDQYDLVSILKEVHQPSSSNTLYKTICLGIMLIHCANVILSHEWWERVWTVQEAALPIQHPNIVFRGYEFSFGDLMAASAAIENLQDTITGHFEACLKDDGDGNPRDLEPVLCVWQHQTTYWMLRRSGFILNRLRQSQISPQVGVAPAYMLLMIFSAYKATDPRDKYFALRALLPKIERDLMYPTYNESVESVFTRATAQCFNTSAKALLLSTRFKLLIESQPDSSNATSHPSWAYDFTYSDSHYHSIAAEDDITFDGYLDHNRSWQPEYREGMEGNRFLATPRTLFCTGVHIGTIHTTGIVPYFDDGTEPGGYGEFICRVHFHRNRRNMGRRKRKFATQIFLRTLSACEAFLYKVTSPRSILGRGVRRLLCDALPKETLNIFTLGREEYVNRATNEEDDTVHDRLKRAAGKPYFITDEGIIGIATAPVRVGDALVVIHMSSAYLVLREVEDPEGERSTQEHRIVARAVVSENQDKMRARIQKLESRDFQIV